MTDHQLSLIQRYYTNWKQALDEYERAQDAAERNGDEEGGIAANRNVCWTMGILAGVENVMAALGYGISEDGIIEKE